jgi:hypothetical protein
VNQQEKACRADQGQDEHIIEIDPAEEFVAGHIAGGQCAQPVDRDQDDDEGLHTQEEMKPFHGTG